MRQCLLCLSLLEEQLNFIDLLQLKRKENNVCQECLNTFEEIPEENCPSCYKAGDKNLCQDCQYWQERGLEVAHKSLYTYNKAMKDYFSRYKFQGDYLLRNVFALSLIHIYRNHIELHDDLTARERDILGLLAKGYENQRIADELYISLKTVKTHVSNILSKLEVSDRTQAVVYAFQHHLVPQEDF